MKPWVSLATAIALMHQTSSTWAMMQANDSIKEEKTLSTPKTISPQIHIISPEGVAIQQKLALIAHMCPRIAQPKPQIESADSFKIAKGYLALTKEYDAILRAAALGGAKIELIDMSQHVLKDLLGYIDTLRGKACNNFRAEEDEKELANDFFEVNYTIGQNYLTLLTQKALTQNLQGAQDYVKKLKDIKIILSENAKYRKLLQSAIEFAQDITPQVRPLFNPTMKSQISRPPRKPSRKIEQLKTIEYHQKIISCVLQDTSEDSLKENFNPYFHLTVNKIATEELSLLSKALSSEHYIQRLQKLTENYKDLEHEGMRFKAKLFGLELSFEPIRLNHDKLVELYQFFCKMLTLPKKDPLQVLEHSIFTFIQANKVEEAMDRTEALKTLLLKKGSLSEEFISFRASVMALNGNCDEWRMILENKRKANEKFKAGQHQQKISHIKKSLEKSQKELEVPEIKIELRQKQVTLETKKRESIPDPFEHALPGLVENYKSQISIPREKIKTRKPPEKATREEETKEPMENPAPILAATSKQSVDYPVSKRAFQTYSKIRREDWKFTRLELYNLFDKLKCSVNISQGKGDHGKISFPLNMAVENDQGLVAIIPEFIGREAPKDIPTLIVPNWDEKWDGRVPPYMTKSILEALDYLGATDATVHKKIEVTSNIHTINL